MALLSPESPANNNEDYLRATANEDFLRATARTLRGTQSTAGVLKYQRGELVFIGEKILKPPLKKGSLHLLFLPGSKTSRKNRITASTRWLKFYLAVQAVHRQKCTSKCSATNCGVLGSILQQPGAYLTTKRKALRGSTDDDSDGSSDKGDDSLDSDDSGCDSDGTGSVGEEDDASAGAGSHPKKKRAKPIPKNKRT